MFSQYVYSFDWYRFSFYCRTCVIWYTFVYDMQAKIFWKQSGKNVFSVYDDYVLG